MLLFVRRYEECLERLCGSAVVANSLVRAVGVTPLGFCMDCGIAEGSSTSFSSGCIVRRLDGGGGECSEEGKAFFRAVFGNGAAVKADRGREALAEDAAELMEACAMFADTDAVGGPDEKIDRLGVVNWAG